MSWRTQVKGDPLPWLLESSSPGVRYLALRDLVDAPGVAELHRARTAAHRQGPIATILRHMDREGYWVRSGPGYNPKYRSSVWAVIALAQLGASVEEDQRIGKACTYLLDHALADGGQFLVTRSGAPAWTATCLQGNLCFSLLQLGFDDPRLSHALDWTARTVTGEGVAAANDMLAPRRFLQYISGPTFACGINADLPCAWGGVKVLLALAALPVDRRTPVIKRAIRHGVDFFLGIDPATAAYPTRKGDKPSRNWWKFGFPVFYVTDLLQLAEALVALGYSQDPRLAGLLQVIRGKQDARGRWRYEFDYINGKMWLDLGKRNRPNKWVTLRALRVLKAAAN